MELGPIWRAILRNKSSYALIALQIAVTMAIMVNAIAIIQERSALTARPSGIDEDNIITLTSISFFDTGCMITWETWAEGSEQRLFNEALDQVELAAECEYSSRKWCSTSQA